MNKSMILGGLLIAVAVIFFITSSGDVASYSTFKEAQEKGSKVKIAGQLSLDKDIKYDPFLDPNLTTFFMKDKDGDEMKVLLKMKKPTDFEQSEQVVVSGYFQEDVFVATEALIKCPSKYKSEEIELRKTVNS